jgi:hypothetical protein
MHPQSSRLKEARQPFEKAGSDLLEIPPLSPDHSWKTNRVILVPGGKRLF